MPKLNKQQSDVLRGFKKGGNISVQAVAGSGKTTVALALQKVTTKDLVYVAFTNATKNVLTKRSPGINCKTLYSMGLAALGSFIRAEVTPGKLALICSKVATEHKKALVSAGVPNSEQGVHLIEGILKDLVQLRLLRLLKAGEHLEVSDCLSHGVDLFTYTEATPLLLQLAERCCTLAFKEFLDQGTVDFTEMIAYPCLVEEVEFTQYEALVVDEAQDLSEAQQRVLALSCGKNSQVCVVGDPNQAIYGFAGAYFDSFQRLRDRLDCSPFRVDTCYRCSENIVEEAQTLVPEIRARDGASKGTVCLGKPEFTEYCGDMLILARYHYELVDEALSLVRRRVPFYYPGDKLKGALRVAMSRFSEVNIRYFTEVIHDWNAQHENDYWASRRIDVNRCLVHLYYDIRPKSWGSFKSGITKFFKRVNSSSGSTLRLSTVHGAKGDEADKVWFKSFYRELKGNDEQLTQERNLNYIAVTRAKNVLWLS